MRFYLIPLFAIALTGCSKGQAEGLDACQAQADRFFPTFQGPDNDDSRSKYIIECMAANGYDLDVLPADCDSKRPFASQSACYRRTSWFDDVLDRIRSAWR
jgi:hypothetical protein